MNVKIIAIAVVAIMIAAGAAAFVVLSNDKKTKSIDVDLEVFGNADKDWKVDENDAKLVEEYLKAKSDGNSDKVSEIEGRMSIRFADANNDGVIDKKDVDQIRKIAAGTATHLWFLDGIQKERDIDLDIKRIGCEYFTNTEMMLILGQGDRVAAVDNAPYVFKDFYFNAKQQAGLKNLVNMSTPDYDLVNSFNLDVLLLFAATTGYDEKRDKIVGCDVLYLGLYTPDIINTSKSNFIQGILKAGYIFGAVERAEGYTNWVLENRDKMLAIANSIPDKDKPVVGMTNYTSTQYFMTESINTFSLYKPADPLGQAVILAGGRNILDIIKAGGGSAYAVTVQVDAVFNDDPNVHVDYFFLHMVKYTYGAAINAGVPDHGYAANNTAEIKAAWENVRSHSLITDEQTVMIAGDFRNGCTGGVLLAAYVGSTINPEAFSDIDPLKLHQEYIDWMGIKNYDIHKKGVFMYPEP